MFSALMKFYWFRRSFYNMQRFPPFFLACLSKDGLVSSKGRKLIWGKMRRATLSLCPPLCRFLQSNYQLSGGCVSCGASCKILFQCPHWDDKTHLCGVYEDRPSICRLFPIMPADLKDRDLVLPGTQCGFKFSKE